MAKDTLRLTSFVFILSFATKISSSHLQPSLTEYLLATYGQQGSTVTHPSRPPLTYGPGYQNYQSPPVYQNQPKPSPILPGPPTPLRAIANLAAAIPIPESKSKTPSVPKASDIPSTTLDSNVLNNLAIALQLLIVSNILNTPPNENLPQTKFESTPKYETVPISPIVLSHPITSALQSSPYTESPIRSLYSYESQNLPNSNFLGSSGFIEPSMLGSALTSFNPRPSPRSSPRTSMSLMSPYEALGPNSPFSDPVLSSLYGTSYSKKDFCSPYASILAAEGNNDLFSVTDFL